MVQPVVTSGESDLDDDDGAHSGHLHVEDESYDDNDNESWNGESAVDERQPTHHGRPLPSDHADIHDDLYDANADEEDDEKYVAKHIRGATAAAHLQEYQTTDDTETPKNPPLNAQKASTSTSETGAESAPKPLRKPPNSDAVLSCPCCFLTVTMDCQKHERYDNQYRAMFVMNIMVKWEQTLRYDRAQKCLMPCPTSETASSSSSPTAQQQQQQTVIPLENSVASSSVAKKGNDQEDQLYYMVCCANCETQVASLDMSDEVYHFYGCLASS